MSLDIWNTSDTITTTKVIDISNTSTSFPMSLCLFFKFNLGLIDILKNPAQFDEFGYITYTHEIITTVNLIDRSITNKSFIVSLFCVCAKNT